MSTFTEIYGDVFAGCQFDDCALHEEGGILRIHLSSDREKKIVVRFDSYFVFRKMDEGDAMNALNMLSSVCKPHISLMHVSESPFLDWFHHESCRIHAGKKVRHYCLITLNSIVDVIATGDPIVEE